MPKIMLLGPPGSGKGTQARVIKEDFGIPVIATGDLLRKNIAERTALGRAAGSYMEAGGLVPDYLVVDLFASRLAEDDTKSGWLLDGFPRTVSEADALDKMLGERGEKLERVFLLEVPKGLLIRRITGRRVCPVCNRVYHIDSMPPKETGICDFDGAALITRDDDDEETAENRIDIYNELTSPLVDYYESRGVLTKIDGTIGTERVEQKIRATLA